MKHKRDRRMGAAAPAALLAALALLATAVPPGNAAAAPRSGWRRQGTEWFYCQEDGSPLKEQDTPDGFRTDQEGRFAGDAAGPGPFPVLQREREEEQRVQAEESARLKKVREDLERLEREAAKHPKGPGEPARPEEDSIELPGPPVYSYTGIWERAGYRELKEQKAVPQLSGLTAGGMPAEFYMLCVAGETSGAVNLMNQISGDGGRAYGLCQCDYRYDLVNFLKHAHGKHPALWAGAEAFFSVPQGDVTLVQNAALRQIFRRALLKDYRTAVADQLEFIRMEYWDEMAEALNRAGFRLGERNVAVSAALLSVSVNCGPPTEEVLRELRPAMSDQELLDGIYRLRNTTLAAARLENRYKGTGDRYLWFEPEMAADLMYGRIGLDSVKIYGEGVEWHGNPF